MTILQFANNALSALASPITSTDTTIYLQAGTGALFPTPTSGQAFLATIYNNSSTSYEIVLVTARAGDTVTIVRAQENTMAQTWLTGNSFGMYPTKGTMEQLIQVDQFQDGKYSFTTAGGTANALTGQINSNFSAVPDGFNFILKGLNANTGAATLQLTLGSNILVSKPIVKGNNYPLIANDIWAGYPLILTYSANFDAYVLQNSGTSVVPPIVTYPASYVLVGGGGGGGTSGNDGGGGGAGGYLASTTTFLPGTVYTVLVGAGGASVSNGSNSSISGVVSTIGGGAGGSGAGANGGSGGGGQGGSVGNYGSLGGYGTPGQGNNGGQGYGYASGGGGGAGAVGGTATPPTGGGFGNAGAGGAGLFTIITGSTVYLAGGGGGGAAFGGTPAAGGIGGGGAGTNSGIGGNGTVNSGGGGGGGSGASGGTGGSGTAYIAVPTANYTGLTTGSPTVTTSGAYTVMHFTTSGTYTA